MPRDSTSVPQLNAAQRQWVILKHANTEFWRELWQRFERARLWGKTIAAMAGGALAWVHWGEGVLAWLSKQF